jgi:pyruvate/2-oxoglutarate dehydrogenase complex dihydrolipoamide acyltransferase (E2) component
VGDPVRAAGPGRISYAGLLAGRGVVVVSHGDLRTTYEPVSAVVRVGQQVAAGQVIGQLAAGHAGCRPACLHWGLLRGTLYLDPVRLITRGPSVLLPVDAAGLADAGAGAGAGVAAAGPAPAQRSGPAPSAAPGAEPRPAGQPAFALRSGDAASAGGALAALVAGLLLLRGPPRPPRRPASPAGGAPTGPRPAAASVVETRVVGLIDLASERRRRRREVA